MRYFPFFTLYFLAILSFACKGQNQTSSSTELSNPSGKEAQVIIDGGAGPDTMILANAPARITRKIRFDKNANLLFAAYADIITYDSSSFSKIPRMEGLESFDAFDAIEDSKGNIWIASNHFGVFRYDGANFTNFTTKDGLLSNRTMCLYEDKKGQIWIATQEGINIYNGQAFQNITKGNGLTSNDINLITEDRKGNIWVGTRGTVCVYDPNSILWKDQILFSEYKSKEGNTFANVWSIVEDQKGNVWLGGQTGLWRVTNDSATSVTSFSTTGVCEDAKGDIWLTTHGTSGPHSAGLSHINLQLIAIDTPVISSIFEGEGMFFGLTADEKGYIWVGTNQGVFRYDKETILYFQEE